MNERRKTTLDQNRIKKVEQAIKDKEKQLEKYKEEFYRRDSDIAQL
jgi:hypothetical protein